MDKRPFFSVVTPSFNQGTWIEGCIRSVLDQATDDFEHIIFDNRSTDETLSVIGKYPHLKCTSESDRGQAEAVNKGIAAARGEIICWLNADDQYAPGAFARVREAFADPGIDVVYGNAREIYFDGRPGGERTARFKQREDFLIWWEKRTDLLQPAVFFRRRVAVETGPLREDLHLALDTELWWRMSARHSFHYLPFVLAIQQRQPDSKTLRLVRRIYDEKRLVFGPILRGDPLLTRCRRWVSCRLGMGRRWLGLAQSAGPANRPAAREFLALSLGENPLLLLTPAWWKACIFTQC